MPNWFRLLKLQRSASNCLEKLWRLKMKLGSAPVNEEPRVLEQISVAIEEIAQVHRLIRDLKASNMQSANS
jgi:hypothetical protein